MVKWAITSTKKVPKKEEQQEKMNNPKLKKTKPGFSLPKSIWDSAII